MIGLELEKYRKLQKTTKTKDRTGNSGASSLQPIGFSIEIRSNNCACETVVCRFERMDIIETTNITFC